MPNVLTIEMFLALIGGLLGVLTLLGVWVRFYFVNKEKDGQKVVDAMAKVAKQNADFRLKNEERFNAIDKELTAELTELKLQFTKMEAKLDALLS